MSLFPRIENRERREEGRSLFLRGMLFPIVSLSRKERPHNRSVAPSNRSVVPSESVGRSFQLSRSFRERELERIALSNRGRSFQVSLFPSLSKCRSFRRSPIVSLLPRVEEVAPSSRRRESLLPREAEMLERARVRVRVRVRVSGMVFSFGEGCCLVKG